jgi:hypothetical protein
MSMTVPFLAIPELLCTPFLRYICHVLDHLLRYSYCSWMESHYVPRYGIIAASAARSHNDPNLLAVEA